MNNKQGLSKLTISLAQMEFQYGQPESNLEKVRTWVDEAAQQESDLALLPELWASGYDLENCGNYADVLGKGLFAHMSNLSREHRIILGGSLLERKGDKVYNTFYFFDKKGGLLATYRKIHLFRLLNEDRWLKAGEEVVLAHNPWGKWGIATCYDLRFPEIFRTYALHGAQLILLVAKKKKKRIAHWRTLLQSRAIENQYFIAAVNKVGYSQGAQLGGCSAVLDPMGVPLVEGGDEESLLTVEVDFKRVKEVRRWMPVFDDRNPPAYEQVKIYGDD